MSATLTTLPVLWLDQQFSLAIGPAVTDAGAGLSMTGQPLLLTITNQTTGERVDLTGADAVLSDATVGGTPVTDAVAAFTKDAAWVAANLTAGWLEIHFWVGEDHRAALRRLACTPAGGRVSP